MDHCNLFNTLVFWILHFGFPGMVNQVSMSQFESDHYSGQFFESQLLNGRCLLEKIWQVNMIIATNLLSSTSLIYLVGFLHLVNQVKMSLFQSDHHFGQFLSINCWNKSYHDDYYCNWFNTNQSLESISLAFWSLRLSPNYLFGFLYLVNQVKPNPKPKPKPSLWLSISGQPG